jgi:deoxyribose-phosphate aldolase
MKLNAPLAAAIEHTNLKADCSHYDMELHCQEALQYQFGAVCIPPYFVKDASRWLSERAKVVTVIGFPMGYATIPSKVEEIKKAFDEGADEVDMMINLCAVKSQSWAYIRNELDSTMRAVFMRGKQMKFIVETGLLSGDELLKILPIAVSEEVQFIKTSSGYHGSGATVEAVKFLREQLPPNVKIKASGGIRTASEAMQMLTAGADRIGTSHSVAMML